MQKRTRCIEKSVVLLEKKKEEEDGDVFGNTSCLFVFQQCKWYSTG